jgi:hypothetical protein
MSMTLETPVGYHGHTSPRGTPVERACMLFLQSELDIAFGFLRLADTETGSHNTTHADELIGKASNSYKAVLDGLATVSLEFEEERLRLREGVRLLQDTIRAVTRRRQQDANLH